MNRSELNTSINTVFDNNRADNSLTPEMVGTELKKVADYAEQQVPYKVYTALLQFVNGSTITSTVIQNTIGNGSKDGINDIAWSYNSSTQPKAVMTNAPFLIDKCIYVPTIYFQNNTAYAIKGTRISDSEFRLFSSEIATSQSSLAFTSGVFVEIRVYN